MTPSPILKQLSFRRLLAYVKPYRLGFVAAAIGMIGYALVDVYFVSQLKDFIDIGINQKNTDYLRYAPIFIIIIFIMRGVFNFIASYCLNWVGTHVVQEMRQQLFQHLIRLPVSFHDQHSTGDLISKITYNTEQIKQTTSRALAVLIREGVFVFGLLVLMFWNSWQLSSIFLLIAPIIAIIVSFVSKRFQQLSKNIQSAMGEVTTCSEQMLNGHKVILSFGGQDIESKRFYAVNNLTRRQDVKMEATRAISVSSIQIIASFALAFVIYMASFPEMLDSLTAGKFTTIVGSMMMLLRPLKQLTTINSEFQRGLIAAESVFQVLDQPTEQDTGTQVLSNIKGEICFKHVNFSYPGHDNQVLHDVSFTAPAGKTIAIVGRSGSGKTTISSLLPRFYDVLDGEISLDGIPIKSCTLASLRQQMAVVSQHVTLFNDTIANNITYGFTEEVSAEQLQEVAEKAHVLEFTANLKDGLDTIIGENGVSLSGGQRQRIAIARALMREAPILILDEATSALDTESERKIQSALNELLKDRTSIVIAHRLSTIENADIILVMEQGRIVEQGDHHSLLQQNGAYAQLYKLQFGAES
ncbi:lipid A export permease/ATP-binding protein MsbA [Rheinheimera sp. MMS21-TC3]|uniref:lipid A export permease/ATP-binding protein MsbA n=1 Tax=Rheinheimera sp. MMS21-TC3 TaxID=3072790 RepID=UPI0028C47C30|nr:lipid A export permease/ATP-binding protein MsbA [Rheinheimera sp. MMS21-TC3]WNO61198.1 lipid A export permease/ATP-binding protein MsbA [Rheinheimera sp. MMS21-TC3]